MLESLEDHVRLLRDRQAILDAITAYCRGIDRLDRELVLSAFHPDAVDDHGMFVGSPQEFVDWAFALHSAEHASHQHSISNHFCELDGDTAHSETYWMVSTIGRESGNLAIAGGRYLDRFERREGVWRIATRVCVPDWRGVPGPTWLSHEAAEALAGGGITARDRTDQSYQRPLSVEPARMKFKFAPTEAALAPKVEK